MGLFDLPAPLFAAADRLMRLAVPRWTILMIWGLVVASLASWIYYWLSPQERIESLKHEAEEARTAMLAYEGDFDGLMPLAGRTLSLSGRRLLLSIGPAIAASLPALFVITYLDAAYGYAEPAPGATIAVRVEPAQAPVTWSSGAPRGADGTFMIRWPEPAAPIQLAQAGGPPLLSLPLRRPVPIVEKFSWWNVLFGNPAGYLPAEAPIDSVVADLPSPQFLNFGPWWMRGWEALFFLSAGIVAIAIKLVFQLH